MKSHEATAQHAVLVPPLVQELTPTTSAELMRRCRIPSVSEKPGGLDLGFLRLGDFGFHRRGLLSLRFISLICLRFARVFGEGHSRPSAKHNGVQGTATAQEPLKHQRPSNNVGVGGLFQVGMHQSQSRTSERPN